jgi:PAS domain S-box-containing protein
MYEVRMTPSQQHQYEGRKGSILVIDDGHASLNLLFTILTEDGYAVCERPLDLWSQLQFVKDTLPDLVLVDVRKPGMDGYQVCAALKSDPTTRAIPVIFISSIDRSMNHAKAMVSSAVDYVTDPFDAQEVLWRIETHISLRRLRENLKSAACNHGPQPVAPNEDLERAFQEIHVLTRVTGCKHAEERVRQAGRELKKAEEALRTSERELGFIVNAMPTLLASARPDGYADFFNQRWIDYTGLPAEQLEGWGWANQLHPDDAEGLLKIWRSSLGSGVPLEAEARMRRFDGAYRWLLFRANALRDELGNIVKWYGTNTDIDDRKRAEDQLRRSEAFLAEGQRLSLTGSFSFRVATDEGTYSEEICRILELKPPVSFAMIRSRIHPEDLPVFTENFERARRGDPSDIRNDLRLLLPDGSVKCIQIVAHRNRDESGQLEYIGTAQDVTQRRLSEEALSKVRSEFAHVARVASLGMLTASIAHEVNQPLSGIITNTDTGLWMLESDPPNVEGARETVRRALRDANRASEMIKRLRALFSQKQVTSGSVDLNEATREVIALSLSELQRNQVLLRTDFDSDLPFITGDRVQLQQVILNLLRNASDAMSPVQDRPRHLLIRTEREEDDRVRLTVQDVGVGFDPDAMDKLFQSFYTTKNDGMGMGLSISRSIVESHKGRLWARRNDGPGATFCFSLPCGREGATVAGGDAI